jgi:hypothetical protein
MRAHAVEEFRTRAGSVGREQSRDREGEAEEGGRDSHGDLRRRRRESVYR